MKHIGGFFELEIPKGSGPLHGDAIPLSTGRAAILATLLAKKPKRLHVPFYICNTVLEQAAIAGVAPVFYALDRELHAAPLPKVEADDMLLVVNYFGLQSAHSTRLGAQFGEQCIVDNTQAFFEPATAGCWTIYSARKYFGVPDGAYLYAPHTIEIDRRIPATPDVRHLLNRLAGRQQTAYRQCRAYEAGLSGDIREMSVISQRLLSAFDYPAASGRRRENFQELHKSLADVNQFSATMDATATPMCYPLLLPEVADRAAIAKHKLYIPTIWQDVIDRQSSSFPFERDFAARLLPLPIDQRYGLSDMRDLLRRLRRAGVIN
ncbi:MAG TPA: hypothetical protein VK961_19135 [Chthoniobacter sp.]|nr:hypothetical protein [Chthoniobacter sp.]